MQRTPWCAVALACAALSASSAFAQSRRALEPVPSPGAAGFVARPDDLSVARPVTVYLHGICGGPERGCEFFRRAVQERSWLVCPAGPQPCGAGASWGGPQHQRSAAIERVVQAAVRSAPGGVDRATPGVLIGFSQGAYEGWRQVRDGRGRWRGAAFIGAYLHLNRAQLEAAGLRRVVFAAGRADGTHATLRATAAALQAEGFPARFVDLGAIGHGYVAGPGAVGWRDALRWLEEDY